ncbi:MAG: hypothetical protein ACLQIB_40135 [Isosphaeraceae bacterium]
MGPNPGQRLGVALEETPVEVPQPDYEALRLSTAKGMHYNARSVPLFGISETCWNLEFDLRETVAVAMYVLSS